jgi:hypothetical protein
VDEKLDWTTDRRRTPRVDLLAELQGHIVTLDEQIQVTQLSLGGMTVETMAPLSPRLRHIFRISFQTSAVTLQARVIHSRVVIRGDTVSYVSGIEFVDPSPAAILDVQRMVEEARGTLE